MRGVLREVLREVRELMHKPLISLCGRIAGGVRVQSPHTPLRARARVGRAARDALPAGRRLMPAHNGRPPRVKLRITRRRQQRFLEMFAATGNVSVSAEAAGISRSGVYVHRGLDAAFAKAWEGRRRWRRTSLKRRRGGGA